MPILDQHQRHLLLLLLQWVYGPNNKKNLFFQRTDTISVISLRLCTKTKAHTFLVYRSRPSVSKNEKDSFACCRRRRDPSATSQYHCSVTPHHTTPLCLGFLFWKGGGGMGPLHTLSHYKCTRTTVLGGPTTIYDFVHKKHAYKFFVLFSSFNSSLPLLLTRIQTSPIHSQKKIQYQLVHLFFRQPTSTQQNHPIPKHQHITRETRRAPRNTDSYNPTLIHSYPESISLPL